MRICLLYRILVVAIFTQLKCAVLYAQESPQTTPRKPTLRSLMGPTATYDGKFFASIEYNSFLSDTSASAIISKIGYHFDYLEVHFGAHTILSSYKVLHASPPPDYTPSGTGELAVNRSDSTKWQIRGYNLGLGYHTNAMFADTKKWKLFIETDFLFGEAEEEKNSRRYSSKLLCTEAGFIYSLMDRNKLMFRGQVGTGWGVFQNKVDSGDNSRLPVTFDYFGVGLTGLF